MLYPKSIPENTNFIPWQPSKWPEYEGDINLFSVAIKRIIDETIIAEIKNVISDAQKVQGDLTHRGHIVALALFCAIDTLSSYSFANSETERCSSCQRGEKIGPVYKKYIEEFFPAEYKPHAEALYKSYRNSMVHSWHLFDVGITPGNEPIISTQGIINVGLLNFFSALQDSVKSFMEVLHNDSAMQKVCIARYNQLKSLARS